MVNGGRRMKKVEKRCSLLLFSLYCIVINFDFGCFDLQKCILLERISIAFFSLMSKPVDYFL